MIWADHQGDRVHGRAVPTRLVMCWRALFVPLNRPHAQDRQHPGIAGRFDEARRRHPVLGNEPDKLSPFKVKLAMAVRSKNAHCRMRDIQRKHWLAVGERHGIISADGRDAQFVIDDLVARTPGVVETVRKALPRNFPEKLADSILTGLQTAANKFAPSFTLRVTREGSWKGRTERR
jgi:hypothetical protein